ncbi:hypothetical protein P691DRAFT_781309 [Macrolepiota fuliginosa MF-IS2]|uniref:DUF6533 domain-containing protein n=1 Tax=Macrolepiota fuliginosa MF-IS2 TaxID=1400762 RepID=A0A9P5XQA1_9AGAR|nr:hypothetical protein P691DRAFT_781309 [Macrolepiota fuliginosa MF-IS2]
MNTTADQLAKGVVRQILLYQVYDYFLTFGDEVELVWASRWTVMKTAFLLDRYLPFPNLIIQQFHLSLFGAYFSGTYFWEQLSTSIMMMHQDSQHIDLSSIPHTPPRAARSTLQDSMRILAMWLLWQLTLGCALDVSRQHAYPSYVVTLAVDFDSMRILAMWLLWQLTLGCALDVSRQHAYPSYVVTLAVDFVMLVLSLVPSIRVCEWQSSCTKGEPRLILTAFWKVSIGMFSPKMAGVLFYVYLCVEFDQPTRPSVWPWLLRT